MILIHGGVLLTMKRDQPIIRNGAVVVDGPAIVAVGDYQALSQQYPSARVLGSETHWVLPGFVNAHHHGGVAGGSFKCGYLDRPLESHLLYLYNSHLGAGQMEVARLNTLYLNACLIRSGVTCTTDFYYGDGSEPYLGAQHGLKAYQESGMRVAFLLSARNQPSMDNGDLDLFMHLFPAELAERARVFSQNYHVIPHKQFLSGWKRLYQDFHDPDGMINIFIGPDGPSRCTPEFLRAIKATAQEHNTGIQMHALETKYQMLHGRREKGMSLIQYLHELDFLGPEVSLAHAIWLTHNDMDLLAETGASISHNASSNLRLFDGIAPVRDMLARGINVALGTDSFGFSDDNDFVEEIRLAALLQRVPGIDEQGLSGQTVLEMATINGAQALGLADQIGSLEPGKRADILTASSQGILSPFMSPMYSPEELFWRRARRHDIRDVLINGQVVMENGQLTTIDVAAVEAELKAWYAQLWTERGDQEQATIETLLEIDDVIKAFFRQYDQEQLPTAYVYNTC